MLVGGPRSGSTTVLCFLTVLEEAGCSLLVSTYQAGQLVAVGVADGELTFSFRGFDRAMGVAVGADRIAVAGKGQIWSLRDHSELAASIAPAGRYDRCWLPRSSTVTGEHPVPRDRLGDQLTAASRTCGSSTLSSPAWPASTPATASCRAGGRRSSLSWPRRTAAT